MKKKSMIGISTFSSITIAIIILLNMKWLGDFLYRTIECYEKKLVSLYIVFINLVLK